jgi:hypothetical protein
MSGKIPWVQLTVASAGSAQVYLSVSHLLTYMAHVQLWVLVIRCCVVSQVLEPVCRLGVS